MKKNYCRVGPPASLYQRTAQPPAASSTIYFLWVLIYKADITCPGMVWTSAWVPSSPPSVLTSYSVLFDCNFAPLPSWWVPWYSHTSGLFQRSCKAIPWRQSVTVGFVLLGKIIKHCYVCKEEQNNLPRHSEWSTMKQGGASAHHGLFLARGAHRSSKIWASCLICIRLVIIEFYDAGVRR